VSLSLDFAREAPITLSLLQQGCQTIRAKGRLPADFSFQPPALRELRKPQDHYSVSCARCERHWQDLRSPCEAGLKPPPKVALMIVRRDAKEDASARS